MATILLVEDDIPLMRLYQSALELEHDVITADTTKAALQAINEQHIDLIILDLNLPDAPGTVILDHLQAHYLNLPVVVITAFTKYKQTLPLGIVVKSLSKPVTTSLLLNTVASAIASTINP